MKCTKCNTEIEDRICKVQSLKYSNEGPGIWDCDLEIYLCFQCYKDIRESLKHAIGVKNES